MLLPRVCVRSSIIFLVGAGQLLTILASSTSNFCRVITGEMGRNAAHVFGLLSINKHGVSFSRWSHIMDLPILCSRLNLTDNWIGLDFESSDEWKQDHAINNHCEWKTKMAHMHWSVSFPYRICALFPDAIHWTSRNSWFSNGRREKMCLFHADANAENNDWDSNARLVRR